MLSNTLNLHSMRNSILQLRVCFFRLFFQLCIPLQTVSLFSFVCAIFIFRLYSLVCSFAATSFIYLLSFSSFDFIHTSKQWKYREKKRRAKENNNNNKAHAHTCTKYGLAIDRTALNHCQCQWYTAQLVLSLSLSLLLLFNRICSRFLVRV